MRNSISIVAVVAFAGIAHAGDPIFIRSNVSDLWGQGGQVNAMNDVFGAGNWQDLRFETSDPADVFSADNSCVMMEGGNDQADELEAYLIANQKLIEAWVVAGGRLIINSAPNEGDGMDLGFGGIQLNYWDGDFDGVAVDTSHPVYDGPWGQAGAVLHGDYWNHASVTGGGISPITLNAVNGNPNLAELDWGNGHVIVGGLTLDFFYSHDLWTQPDSRIYLSNLISYNCDASAPCVADMDGNGVLNIFDFLAFQSAFGNEDPAADLAPPFGVFNIFDFLAFQTAFGNGC